MVILFKFSHIVNRLDIGHSFLRYHIEITNIEPGAAVYDYIALEDNFFPCLFNSIKLPLETLK